MLKIKFKELEKVSKTCWKSTYIYVVQELTQHKYISSSHF
jgi:hypothetical protein